MYGGPFRPFVEGSEGGVAGGDGDGHDFKLVKPSLREAV
jgi:hypothetical protein